jgi:hypothetical protein
VRPYKGNEPPSLLQHKTEMERRLLVPLGGMPGGGSQGGDAEELASEVAGLRLQLVEALEELEARERELGEAGQAVSGQQQKMQALSDQVPGQGARRMPGTAACLRLVARTALTDCGG